MRGTDIEFVPVFYAYVIITQEELHFYLLDDKRYTNEINQHFEVEGLTNFSVSDYTTILAGFSTVVCKQ